jgi:prolyl-tRNA synthetase
MRWSQYFIPTLREEPADAEVVSHKLLLRAGMIRQLAAGIYSYLPLAQRCLQKIEAIVREEMNRIGGQEFYLPALNPREIWEEAGRWTVMGDNMFRLKDRKGADLCLGMTHEEVFTSIARHELRSYKQLPQTWYQIQTKFRDEPRPKSGLLRVRQFTMKDSYSFDVDQKGLDASFENHREAYKKVFTRCGLKFVMVEASSGAMGGSASTEFMVKTDAGEDLIAVCEESGYAANLEKATSKLPEIADEEGLAAPEEFPTPGIKTIEALAQAFDFADATRQIKTLVYVATFEPDEQKIVLALLRGDHQLQETKLQDNLGAIAVRPAHDEEIFGLLGAHAGSLGGVRAQEIAKANGKEVFIIADAALKNRKNMTTGANRDDFHLKGVAPERDVKIDKWADLRAVQPGEMSPDGAGVLAIYKSLEVGHIFKLGTKYSESMGARVLDENGKAVPVIMGSYGIGVERIMAAAIEQNHDADGIIWTPAIAPFDAVVSITNIKQPELVETGEKIYNNLRVNGFDTLLDDRDERAGVKFKDADLIGIPFRINVGKRAGEGIVELVNRRTKETEDVKIEEVLERLTKLWQSQ